MDHMNGVKHCTCSHHKVIPALVIIFGAVFAMGYWGLLSWDAVNIAWPTIVILAGIMKIVSMSKMCKCC